MLSALKTSPAKAAATRRILIFLSGIPVILVYLWAASAGGKSFAPTIPEFDHYTFLTHAFLAGQTSLLIRPAPEMMALPDPRDPVANRPYRLHDASLYNGKYYVYFGPVPVLTLFIPVKLLSHRDLPTGLACALFMSGGFLLSCALFFALARAADLTIPLWFRVAAVTTLGLCQFAPIVLTRPSTYETAVGAGYCFFMGGLLLLFRAMNNPGRWTPLFAGVLIALTPGCRPLYAATAGLIACLYAAFLYFRDKSWRFLRGPEIYLFTAPIVIAGVALAWYNYVRFSNPFEFGINYCLTSDPPTGAQFQLSNVLPGLYYFLFSPPLFRNSFPFINFILNIYPWGRLPESYRIEMMSGAIAATPIVIAACFAPLLLKKRAASFITLTLCFTSIAMLLLLSAIGWAIQRYCMDFVPALLVLACLIVAALLARTTGIARTILTAGVVMAIAYSVSVHAASLLNKYTTMVAHPYLVSPRSAAAVRKLSSFLDSRLNGAPAGIRIYERVEWSFRAKASFPPNPSTGTEPILAAGTSEAGNLLGVRYENGQVRFAFDQTGHEPILGPAFSAEAGKEYDVQAYFAPQTGRLEVQLNGASMLDATVSMLPIDPDGVAIGSDSIRAGRLTRGFSGKLDVLRCELTPEGNYIPVAFTTEYPYSRGIVVGGLPGRDPQAIFERVVLVPDAEPFRNILKAGDVLEFHVSGKRKILEVRRSDRGLEVLLDRRVNPYADGWPRVAARVVN